MHNQQRPLALRRMALVPLIVAAALLAACDKDKKAGSEKASQAAARVNDQELTVHQINLVMERQQGLKPEQADSAGRQILEGLIDQELAVQKAEEEKIDRDPKFVQQLDAQRRALLAQAYLAKASGAAITPPSGNEIQKYFDAKPGLFSNRRIYMLQDFTIEGDDAQTKDLQEKLQATTSVQQFAEVLKASGQKFAVNQLTQPAESLPLGLVDQLNTVKDGQALYQRGDGGMKAILVVASRSQPLTFDQSKPLIERFLTETKRQEWVQKHIKDLRTGAKVEYIGKFAEKAASAPNQASAPAAGALQPAASAPASSSETMDPNSLSKGLSGLK